MNEESQEPDDLAAPKWGSEGWHSYVGERVREVWGTLSPDLRTRIYWDAEEMDNEAWNDGIDARGEDR